jgi:hypothetical protein
MNKNLINLINKVQNKFGEDAFEVTNHSVDTILSGEVEVIKIYNEGNLTKNYVMFVTDLLTEKFGPVTEDIILSFGESLKTDKKDFKESYQSKTSSLKEILPSVFIHTSMSKIMMESFLVDIVKSAKLSIKFNDLNTKKWTSKMITQEALKYKTTHEFINKSPEAYKAAVRHGMKSEIAKKIKENKL